MRLSCRRRVVFYVQTTFRYKQSENNYRVFKKTYIMLTHMAYVFIVGQARKRATLLLSMSSPIIVIMTDFNFFSLAHFADNLQ